MPDPVQPLAYETPDENRPASAAPTEAELEAESFHPSAKHDPYAALRFPAYRIFSIGSMVAAIFIHMTVIALCLEIFDLTHSSLVFVCLVCMLLTPLVILALPAVLDTFRL